MQGDSKNKVIEGYVELINTLSPSMKKQLLAEISGEESPVNNVTKAFGAWEATENAESIIDKIRESRKFSRETDLF